MMSTGLVLRFGLIALLLCWARPSVGQQEEPVQKVRYLSDLRPKAPDQELRAELLDCKACERITGPVRTHLDVGEGPPPAPNLSADGTVVYAPQRTRDELLRQSVCSSDIVVIGRPVSKNAMLNKSETFLFTDIVVLVDNWIRPTLGERSVLVAVFGGSVEVAGEELTTFVRPIPRLGQSEAFFLKQIPKQRAYQLNGQPIPTSREEMATPGAEPVAMLDLQQAAKSCGHK